MRFPAGLIVAVVCLTATPLASRADPLSVSAADPDSVAHISTARITLTNQQRFLASSLTILDDSLSYDRTGLTVGYEAPDERDRIRLSLNDVELVEVQSGDRMLLGTIIGALTGTGLTIAMAADEGNTAGMAVLAGSLFFVLPGAVIGAVIGNSIEHWDTVYPASRD